MELDVFEGASVYKVGYIVSWFPHISYQKAENM